MESFGSSQTLLDFLILLQNILHRIVGEERLKTKLIYLIKHQTFFRNLLKPDEIARPLKYNKK